MSSGCHLNKGILKITKCFIVFFLVSGKVLAGIGDGPRAYQTGPVGAQKIGITYSHKNSSFNLDGSPAEPAARVKADFAAVQYVRVVEVKNKVVGLFAYVPFGEISETLLQSPTQSQSTGVGDIAIGGAIGLYGAPPLTRKEYIQFKPDFSFGLIGKLTLPTGEYSENSFTNLGSNRWSTRLGAAFSWYFGESLLAGHNTSLELTPSVSIFGDNDNPYEADTLKQKEVYSLETNLTHDFNSRFWGSIDALYVIGGATISDGVKSQNETERFALGFSLGMYLSHGFAIQANYGKTLKVDAEGFHDYSFRIKMSKGF